MGAGSGGKNLISSEKQRAGSWGDEQRRRRDAVSRHQHQEWKTMHRRVNDIRKDERPALDKYEWAMMGKDGTWKEYKEMENVKAWGCLLHGHLLGPDHVLRETIDDAIRMYKLEGIEAQLRKCRA